MTRAELDTKFDEALAQSMNTDRWTAGGMQAYAVIALAIAVRGLWPKEKKPKKLRGNILPMNHGGG